MPLGIKALFVYHGLILVRTLVLFAIAAPGILLAPLLFGLLLLGMFAGFIALLVAILLGTWNRRPGAWFGMALVQIIAIPAQVVIAISEPVRTTATISLVVVLIAIAAIVYLLTPPVQSWFQIQAQKAIRKDADLRSS